MPLGRLQIGQRIAATLEQQHTGVVLQLIVGLVAQFNNLLQIIRRHLTLFNVVAQRHQFMIDVFDRRLRNRRAERPDTRSGVIFTGSQVHLQPRQAVHVTRNITLIHSEIWYFARRRRMQVRTDNVRLCTGSKKSHVSPQLEHLIGFNHRQSGQSFAQTSAGGKLTDSRDNFCDEREGRTAHARLYPYHASWRHAMRSAGHALVITRLQRHYIIDSNCAYIYFCINL